MADPSSPEPDTRPDFCHQVAFEKEVVTCLGGRSGESKRHQPRLVAMVPYLSWIRCGSCPECQARFVGIKKS